MQPPQFVAIDTNILFRLLDKDEPVLDAWQLIRSRIKRAEFVAPPTVLGEVADKVRPGNQPEIQERARRILTELRSRWNVTPVRLSGLQEALVNNAAEEARRLGLIPYEERNDARIIAEAAILNCILLVTSDSHLLAADYRRLSVLFRQLDLPAPVIASPEDLLRRFFA
jgi:predicted nucleic acid-binding protein